MFFLLERKSTPSFQRGFLVSRFFGGFHLRAFVGAFGGTFCISRSCLSFSSNMADCRSSFTQATIAGSGFAFGAMAVFSFPVNLLPPPRLDSVPRLFATPCGGCSSKAMARDLQAKRDRYTRQRLQKLRQVVPVLPAEALDHCNLRRLSFAIRRCGGPCQLTLDSTHVDPVDGDASFAAPPPSLLCSPSPDRLGR